MRVPETNHRLLLRSQERSDLTMLERVKPTPDVRAIYEEVIDRLLNGDMKDKQNDNGWTFVEELARQMLLDPKRPPRQPRRRRHGAVYRA
jgi:hypothetical protein